MSNFNNEKNNQGNRQNQTTYNQDKSGSYNQDKGTGFNKDKDHSSQQGGFNKTPGKDHNQR